MPKIIRVKAVVIGDKYLDHQFSAPDGATDLKGLATEFLKRSYPKDFKSITDITAKEIKKQ